MITLRKAEQIEIYQVVIALSEKTKQSPFIAVLILAREQGEITAETLKDYLLPTLPIRACNNLLIRLTQQGYLEKKRQQNFRNDILGRIFYDQDESDYNNSIFILTELGEQSAINKSFWVGEKGIFNVYVSDSNLLNQKIIKTEKVDRSEDDRNGNKITKTPYFISQYHNQILNLNKKEIRIEEIEDKCFQLKPLECSLEIETKEDDALIRIKEKQTLFQSSFKINENELKEKLLTNTNEFDYDENKKAILVEFDPDNLSFVRKVKLQSPYYLENRFNQVEIDNVSYFPNNVDSATLWFVKLLLENISTYFITEQDFFSYSKQYAIKFETYYEVSIPSKTTFLNYIKDNYDEESYFYEIAKLETIDYLNY